MPEPMTLEPFNGNRHDATPVAEPTPDLRYAALRKLGSLAWQLRASMRAADRFVATGGEQDHDTGAWLVSTAVDLAAGVSEELESLAWGLQEGPTDPGLAAAVQRLRVRAHQLHAAARAADHFLEQESHDDRDTGGWLIATALGLADKLASEVDDVASSVRRPAGADAVVDARDNLGRRRPGQANGQAWRAA